MNAATALDTLDQRLSGDMSALQEVAQELSRCDGRLPQRINADGAKVEQGLAKLALTLIELVRQLLEKQALRRMEGGSLSDEQIERMGGVFLKLATKMDELKVAFGLQDEELNLDLGPLGNLI